MYVAEKIIMAMKKITCITKFIVPKFLRVSKSLVLELINKKIKEIIINRTIDNI